MLSLESSLLFSGLVPSACVPSYLGAFESGEKVKDGENEAGDAYVSTVCTVQVEVEVMSEGASAEGGWERRICDVDCDFGGAPRLLCSRRAMTSPTTELPIAVLEAASYVYKCQIDTMSEGSCQTM